MEYYITNEDGTPYIPENIRIKKGGGNFISVETRCRADEYIKKVTVDKGLTIAYYGGDLMGQYKNIEGKGNTRLHTRSGINGEGKYIFEFSQNTEAVRNFTIANEIHDLIRTAHAAVFFDPVVPARAMTAPTAAMAAPVSMVGRTPTASNILPPIRLASTDPMVVMLKARLWALAESFGATTLLA